MWVWVDWDIWEMISEDLSSSEGLGGKEIRSSTLSVSSGLVGSHSITPGFGGNGVLTSIIRPGVAEAV